MATTTASLELDTGVEVEVGRRCVEERRRGERALGTKGAAAGRAGFLVVEPKNAWAGERVKPGRRVELESVVEKKKLKNRERFRFLIPASSFEFSVSLHAPVRPCPYMRLGELACRGPSF